MNFDNLVIFYLIVLCGSMPLLVIPYHISALKKILMTFNMHTFINYSKMR